MSNFDLRKFLTENKLTDTSKRLYENLSKVIDNLPNQIASNLEGEDNREFILSKSGDYSLQLSEDKGEYVVSINDETKDGYPIKVYGSDKDPKKVADMYMKVFKGDWKKYSNK